MPQVETTDKVSIAPNNIEISNDTSLRIGASALENSVLQFGDSRDAFRTLLGDIGRSLDQPGEIRATLNDLGEFAGKPCAINDNGFHIANTLNTLIGFNRLATDKNDEALKSEIATKVNQIVQELDKRDSSIRTTSLTSNIGFFSYDALGGLLKEFPLTTEVSDKLAERIDAAAHRYSENLPIEKVKEYLFGIIETKKDGNFVIKPGLLDASVQLDTDNSSQFRKILGELDRKELAHRNIDIKFDILNLINDALDNNIIIKQGSPDTIDSKFLQLMVYSMKKFKGVVDSINTESRKTQPNYIAIQENTTKLRQILEKYNQTFTHAETLFASRNIEGESTKPSIMEYQALYVINQQYYEELYSAQQKLPKEKWANGKFANPHNIMLNVKFDADSIVNDLNDIRNAIKLSSYTSITPNIIRRLTFKIIGPDKVKDSLQLLDFIYSKFRNSTSRIKIPLETSTTIDTFLSSVLNTYPEILEDPYYLELFNNNRKCMGHHTITLEKPVDVTEALKPNP